VDVSDARTAEDVGEDVAAACSRLLDDLPDTLLGEERRDVSPADALAAAWGDPVIELRCGVPRPDGFGRASECVVVNDVDWFVQGDDLVDPEGSEVELTVVNRSAYVSVVEPVEYGPPAELLADLSASVTEHLPATGSCV
jgi:hypothetical protein